MPLSGGTFTGATIYNDNVKSIFGTGSDLEIYHNGSGSKIHNNTGRLDIEGDQISLWNHAGNEYLANFNADGAVELYHNNVKTVMTSANGLKVIGPEGGDAEIQINADEGDDNADYWSIKSDTSGNFKVGNYSTGSWVNGLTLDGSNNATFAANVTVTGDLTVSGTTTTINTQTLDVEDKNVVIGKVSSPSDTTADGGGWTLKGASDKTFNWVNATDAWTSSEHIHLGDNKTLHLGTGQDLQIYHDGTNNILRNVGTRLDIIVNSSETAAVFNPNGSVDLYHDNSKKLETTSGGINVTGAINVNGSALSSAPTITATATGSIAANTAVHVKSDGTVQTAVVTAPTLGSLGTASGGEDDIPWSLVYKASTNTLVVVFKDAGNGRPTAMAGTISGTTISWGAETELMNGNDYDVEGGLSVVVDPSDGSYVMTYHANVGGNYTRWQIFTVDGTTITNDGSAMGTVDTANNEQGMMVNTGANTFVITYNDGSQKARKGTRSGNSISWSGETTLYSNDYANFCYLSGPGKIVLPYSYQGLQIKILDVAAMSVGSEVEIDTSNANDLASAACGANNVIVAYRRDSSSYNLHIIAGYMADGDSSVTWGTAVDVGVACDKPDVFYNSSTGNAVVSYAKVVGGSPNGRYTRDVSFSGTNNTTCTAGSETTLYYSSSASTANTSGSKRTSAHCSENGQDVFLFRISNTGTRYKARTGETSSMNDENFIGFSDGTSYTNGQTATINVVGNTTTQSSLTPGQKYYLSNDGSIGTTKKSITVPAGIALTSTKLLIKG
jgi:hypothetical protein